MKIGFFNTIVPYKNFLTDDVLMDYKGGGGVENVVYNLSIQLAKKNHEIYIFSSSINKKESIEKYGNINIFRYKKSFQIGRSPVSLDLLHKPLKTIKKLDIVHAHLGNLPAPVIAYRYAKKKKRPLVITYHGEPIHTYGSPLRQLGVLFQRMYYTDKLLSNADRIIALSENSINQSHFLRKYRDKIRVIPNGINLDDYNIELSKEECRKKINVPLDKHVILFVGSLVKFKAVDILFKAMKQIIKTIPDSYLIIIGDGPLRTHLEAQAKKNDIDKYVRFVGTINDTSLKAVYYKSSDIFILPSLVECFPIVLLEASATGIPLLVSNLESLKAIIRDDHNGVFFNTGNENDLALKIMYLLQNDNLRRKIGDNAKEMVKEYTWEKISKETEKIYLELTENTPEKK